MGAVSRRSWPNVNSFSFTKLAVVAAALRLVGHPVATGSCRLERCVTGCFHGPKVWIKTLFVFCLISAQTGILVPLIEAWLFPPIGIQRRHTQVQLRTPEPVS